VNVVTTSNDGADADADVEEGEKNTWNRILHSDGGTKDERV
jgi:hypothetical protein